MRWKEIRVVLLFHSGQWSSSEWMWWWGTWQGLNWCMIFRGNKIHLFSQSVCRCYNETAFITVCVSFTDLFPQMWIEPRQLSTIPFDYWTCFSVLFMSGQAHLRAETHTHSTKCHYRQPFEKPEQLCLFVSFSLPVWIGGSTYWSVLFLSCGFETVPTLWMSDDSLPLG